MSQIWFSRLPWVCHETLKSMNLLKNAIHRKFWGFGRCRYIYIIMHILIYDKIWNFVWICMSDDYTLSNDTWGSPSPPVVTTLHPVISRPLPLFEERRDNTCSLGKLLNQTWGFQYPKWMYGGRTENYRLLSFFVQYQHGLKCDGPKTLSTFIHSATFGFLFTHQPPTVRWFAGWPKQIT